MEKELAELVEDNNRVLQQMREHLEMKKHSEEVTSGEEDLNDHTRPKPNGKGRKLQSCIQIGKNEEKTEGDRSALDKSSANDKIEELETKMKIL